MIRRAQLGALIVAVACLLGGAAFLTFGQPDAGAQQSGCGPCNPWTLAARGANATWTVVVGTNGGITLKRPSGKFLVLTSANSGGEIVYDGGSAGAAGSVYEFGDAAVGFAQNVPTGDTYAWKINNVNNLTLSNAASGGLTMGGSGTKFIALSMSALGAGSGFTAQDATVGPAVLYPAGGVVGGSVQALRADGATAVAVGIGHQGTAFATQGARLLDVKDGMAADGSGGTTKAGFGAFGGLYTTSSFGLGASSLSAPFSQTANIAANGSITSYVAGATAAAFAALGTAAYVAADFFRPATAGGNTEFADSAGNRELILFDDGTTGSAQLTGTKSRGTITLSAGTGTATVNSGAICTCVDSTAANVVKCSVSSTTLTATGTNVDVISYLCL